MTTDPRVLRLFPDDNIVVATTAIEAGETLLIDGQDTLIAASIPLGHKIAAHEIKTGEKILKYGASIGSATCDIKVGEHVHTHNMKSDYLPTYLREGSDRYVRNN